MKLSVPHPIPYQGSKRNLAPQILAYLPADTDRLIEPFAGSAAISLAASRQGGAQRFRLNDVNRPLMQLWQEIVERPHALADAYEHRWSAQQGREREYYALVRARFNRTPTPADLLYLLARCVKASIRYNRAGAFNQSQDNRRQGARPDTMRAHIIGAARLLQGKTELWATDYAEAVADAAPRDVVYLDPPYQGVCGARDRRYIGGITYEVFVDRLREWNIRNVSYLLSYDGATGDKTFGQSLPASLDLTHITLAAGRSSQATLLGRAEPTIESLYLSPALAARLPETLPSGRQQAALVCRTDRHGEYA